LEKEGDMAKAGAQVGERAVVRSGKRSRDKAGAAAKAAAGSLRKSYRLMVRAWPEASLGEGGARAGRRNRNKGRRGGRSIVGRRIGIW